jgi:hypothetical protein
MDTIIEPLMKAEASRTAYKHDFYKNGYTGYVSVETDGKESNISVTY